MYEFYSFKLRTSRNISSSFFTSAKRLSYRVENTPRDFPIPSEFYRRNLFCFNHPVNCRSADLQSLTKFFYRHVWFIHLLPLSEPKLSKKHPFIFSLITIQYRSWSVIIFLLMHSKKIIFYSQTYMLIIIKIYIVPTKTERRNAGTPKEENDLMTKK